jgi:hypothetical protein
MPPGPRKQARKAFIQKREAISATKMKAVFFERKKAVFGICAE